VIRVDPRPDERLVGRRIIEDERLLVARPGVPVTLGRENEDLGESTPAVGHSATPADIVWRIATKDGTRVISPRFSLRFSSFLMVRDALLAGAGCALMPRLLVESDLAAGRLVSWGTQDSPKVEIWALQNTRRLSSTKIRAFLEALAALN